MFKISLPSRLTKVPSPLKTGKHKSTGVKPLT